MHCLGVTHCPLLLHRDINGAEQFRNVVIKENYLSGVAVSEVAACAILVNAVQCSVTLGPLVHTMQGFMVAYDVTDADSFQHLETWLDTIKQVRTDMMHLLSPRCMT